MIAPEQLTAELAQSARARIVSGLSPHLADFLASDPQVRAEVRELS